MDNKSQANPDLHHHQHTEEIVNQLKTTIENLQMIQRMVSDSRSCTDVLSQLSGVFIRLNECRMTIVHDHINSCLSPALKPGQETLLLEVEQILRRVLSGPTIGSFH